MLKKIMYCLCVFVLISGLSGCKIADKDIKIGVSFGVGEATRWPQEMKYMEERAKELGVQMETRLNLSDKPKTQIQDCKELIDSGIDTLILTPRNGNDVNEIFDYAKEKNVKLISYARAVLGHEVDLFIGYDCDSIGQSLGQYLSEYVTTGNYIILMGDENDGNAQLLHQGAMRFIEPIRDDINIILEEDVPNWSPDEAKRMVVEALVANGNNVDAILAPNDKIAGACVEALKELNITKKVMITGMDAEIDAAKRIIRGEQDITIYMDLKQMATIAVDEAVNFAKGDEVNVNATFQNKTENGVDANLINGKLVTQKNIDKTLIDSGFYTREQLYGMGQ